MKTINSSFLRIYSLIERYIVLNLKAIAITISTLACVLIALSLLNTWFNHRLFSAEHFVSQARSFFIFGGLVFTSLVFKEMSNFAKGWFYMMLPANRIEKLVAYWLLTTVLYSAFALVLLVLVSIIISGMVSLIFEPVWFVFNPFAFQFHELLLHFLILHSIFFLGAISFRKNHFFSTTLFALLIIGGIFLFSYLGFRLIFGERMLLFDSKSIDTKFLTQIGYWAKVVYYGLLAPFFLLVSYFRFKEKEI